MTRRLAAASTVVLLLVSGCQSSEEEVPYDRSLKVVGSLIVDYCTYGAVSVQQLRGCLYHVAADDIEVLDTPAASYALSGQGAAECGRDAGPFCGPGERQDRALMKALGLQ